MVPRLSPKPSITTTNSVPVSTSLSREAQILLKEASQDHDGKIMRMLTDAGLIVETNDKEFTKGNNPRQRATYEGAIEELEILGLIKDHEYRREVFEVTKEGFKIADRLRYEKSQQSLIVSIF